MTFEQALSHLKNGAILYRDKYSEKRVFEEAYMDDQIIIVDEYHDNSYEQVLSDEEISALKYPYEFSSDDILADDWHVLHEKEIA